MANASSAHLVDGEVGEQRLGLLVRDRRVDDDIVALLPVHGGGDTVLVADLQSYFGRRPVSSPSAGYQ